MGNPMMTPKRTIDEDWKRRTNPVLDSMLAERYLEESGAKHHKLAALSLWELDVQAEPDNMDLVATW